MTNIRLNIAKIGARGLHGKSAYEIAVDEGFEGTVEEWIALNENLPVGTTAGTVAAGDDARLSDNRTPTDSSVTDVKIATTLSPSKITGTAVVTADSRLTDQRVPTDGSVTSAKIANDSILNEDINASAEIAPSKIAGTAVVTADSRLTDQRTPTDNSVTSAKITDGSILNVDINAAAEIATSKIAGLDATLTAKADLVGGVVPTSQIPSLAINDTFVSVSQAAMLDLTAQVGDICVRSDLTKTFVLQASPASILGNWVEMAATGNVLSVNTQQGAIVLGAGDVGADPAGSASTAQTEAQSFATALVDDLSGVTNATTARSNLGLGTAATTAAADYVPKAVVTAADDFIVATGSGAVTNLPVAASRIIGKKAAGAAGALTAAEAKTILAIANTDVSGLGGAAVLNVGTTAGTVAAGDAVPPPANLTGPITSVGAATSIAAQTGTGTTFAMSAGPTFTGTTILGSAAYVSHAAANNTIYGLGAFRAAATGTDNTAVGTNSLKSLTSGVGNTAIGFSAAGAFTSASNLVAIGKSAGNSLSGSAVGENTIVGSNAYSQGTSGNQNVAVGQQSMFSADSVFDCVSVGYKAGRVAAGSFNVAAGSNAMLNATTATGATAVGYQAMGTGVTTSAAVGPTAIGYQALKDLTTGANNTAVGYQGGLGLTTGANNTVLGFEAGRALTDTSNNVAIGYQALRVSGYAADTVAIGSGSLVASTSAIRNTAVGSKALPAVTTGGSNTALGYYAGEQIISGANNTCVGRHSGPNSSATSDSTSVGFSAEVASYGSSLGRSASAYATYSVSIGYDSKAETGSYSIALGSGTRALAGGSVAIGASSAGVAATTSVANEFMFGTSSHSYNFPGTGLHTYAEASNIALGTVTGTKFGTSTTQKLAFFNSAPVVQPTGVAVDAAGIHAALVTLGLIAA